MAQKTYFALSSFDHPPDHTIQLGQLITQPSTPWARLASPLPISESAIASTVKQDWGTELRRDREQRVGIWAQFAAMILGVGADAVVSWSQQHTDVFQFEELETQFFEPELEYVQASVAGVAKWVKANPRKSVYMVTGVKIARGAQHLTAHAKGIDFDFKPGVDAMPFVGVPISGGPLVGAGRKRGEMTWFSDSSDFVFAYRLRRIIIKRQGVGKSKEFIKGATVMDADGNLAPVSGMSPLKPRDLNEDMEIVSVENSQHDYGSNGYQLDGYSSQPARDELDDEECILQIREDPLAVYYV